jgi:hypothetical protein
MRKIPRAHVLLALLAGFAGFPVFILFAVNPAIAAAARPYVQEVSATAESKYKAMIDKLQEDEADAERRKTAGFERKSPNAVAVESAGQASATAVQAANTAPTVKLPILTGRSMVDLDRLVPTTEQRTK